MYPIQTIQRERNNNWQDNKICNTLKNAKKKHKVKLSGVKRKKMELLAIELNYFDKNVGSLG